MRLNKTIKTSLSAALYLSCALGAMDFLCADNTGSQIDTKRLVDSYSVPQDPMKKYTGATGQMRDKSEKAARNAKNKLFRKGSKLFMTMARNRKEETEKMLPPDVKAQDVSNKINHMEKELQNLMDAVHAEAKSQNMRSQQVYIQSAIVESLLKVTRGETNKWMKMDNISDQIVARYIQKANKASEAGQRN